MDELSLKGINTTRLAIEERDRETWAVKRDSCVRFMHTCTKNVRFVSVVSGSEGFVSGLCQERNDIKATGNAAFSVLCQMCQVKIQVQF